jgi:hypothetical protein
MPAPLNPNLWPSVLHDEDGIPIGPLNPLPVTGGGGGGGAPPNQPTFAANQQTVAVPGTAAQLQAQAVPNGFQIFVRALITNNGTIYVGPSAADAQNHAKATPLEPGAFVELALTGVSAIWIDADDANDGVSWIVEIA